jgi:hypothetical protein
MRIDLSNPFNEGCSNLKTWRSRYSKSEYPSKIVLNTFYRQYTMQSIWDNQIDKSFTALSGSETDIITGFQKLEQAYSTASTQFTVGNTLTDLMNKKQDVGGLNYANNIPLIARGQNGDNAAIEELEFTYLHYLLCNKSVLMWAAFGRKGFTRIDAIAQITGAVIEFTQPMTYAAILNILGKLGVAAKMNEYYSPLPNLL